MFERLTSGYRQFQRMAVEMGSSTRFRFVIAGQYFDECGLARSIGAQQTVNFLTANIDIDAVQCQDTTKFLGYSTNRKRGGLIHRA